MKMLIQTQLSNYDTHGQFILEADSGWQMMMGRVRVMMELDSELHIDIMGPHTKDSDFDGNGQVKTDPLDLNNDLFKTYSNRLRYIPHYIEPNALATRYNFDMEQMSFALRLDLHKTTLPEERYDIVYLNDPMHLRNFKALFFLRGGYTPKFVVHSHFIDNPDNPKFPRAASLWMGQCEAARKADLNFWQCESSMNIFFEQMAKEYNTSVVKHVQEKSSPWDDGYSSDEITSPYDVSRVRFNIDELKKLASEKIVIFVPNRIGKKGISSDYTNCGHFMFNVLKDLSLFRCAKTGKRDYVVLCGNPSQKILNQELENACGVFGYKNLVPDAFNRDEFKCVVQHSHISLGLYTNDSYGGTVARECIELGCLPFWVNNYEYKSIAEEAGYPHLSDPSLENLAADLSILIDDVINPFLNSKKQNYIKRLQEVVRNKCSYEKTTIDAFRKIQNLLR